MAIHTGTADERDSDYFGPAVDRVARILSLGHGGQVLVSGASANLLRENLPKGGVLHELGEYALKDIERPEPVFQLVVQDLRREFPPLRAKSAERPWLVPDAERTRCFAGRDDVLDQMHRLVKQRHRIVISGLGGIGKTQTALEFASRRRGDYAAGVFWVNAETLGTLTAGYVEIAKTLRLPGADASDQERAVQAALAHFESQSSWLLILDNVEERRAIVPFVPRNLTGDVLITSREPVFPELGVVRAVELDDLSSEDAASFLLTRCGRGDAARDELAAAAELARDLGNLPLALEQAAAYIVETGATFTGYLAAFRKRRVALLERAGSLVSHETLAVTWSANFETVERLAPAAAEALRISAFFAPAAVPFECLERGAAAIGGAMAEALSDVDELSVFELLRPLTRYSLIRSDSAARTYSVHRLVQEIVRASLSVTEGGSYAARAAAVLGAAFPAVEFANWTACERLLPHVVTIGEHLDANADLPAVHALTSAGGYLIERSRYAEAQVLLRRAVELAESALGAEHAEVGRALVLLGSAAMYFGRHDEARTLQERALTVLERALGPQDISVADALTMLGNITLREGRYLESRPFFARALDIRRRALGTEHRLTAIGLNNLGVVSELLGRYREAEDLHRQALAIRTRVLGPEHPHTAYSEWNLGNIYLHAGRYAEAEVALRQSLETRERALGPDHPDFGDSLVALGTTLCRLGRYDEALGLTERARDLFERTFGPKSHDVVSGIVAVAEVYAAQGRVDDAEVFYQKALGIVESVAGPDHPDVAFALHGLAEIQRARGSLAEAEPHYLRALALRERSHGETHPLVADSLAGLARLRADQGLHAESSALVARATSIRRGAYGLEDGPAATFAP